MKKTSIILIKTSSKYAYDNGINYVLVPKFEKGKAILSKINGEVKAQLTQPRNLELLQKLFAIAETCCIQNIFKKLINRWELAKQVFNIVLEINESAIQGIRAEYKRDCYSLVFICKYLFLPFERELKPNGEIGLKISSVALESMDEIVFQEFYNKCVEFWSFILDINRSKLE